MMMMMMMMMMKLEVGVRCWIVSVDEKMCALQKRMESYVILKLGRAAKFHFASLFASNPLALPA